MPMALRVFLFALALIGVASPVTAQILEGAESLLPEISVRGQGWALLFQPRELAEFALSLIEAAFMTAAIVFHPVAMAERRKRTDFDAPRRLFIYALIGMVVGFLIMHHGYLIGFVLFGLGGLLRFKSDDASGDTMRLILVTLIGLCVGLDLPVIALITAASAFAILYFVGGPAHFALEIRFKAKKLAEGQAELLVKQVAKQLFECGYPTIAMTKTKFQPVAEFVLSGPRGGTRNGLMHEMARIAEIKENAIEDWHVD